MKYEGDNIISMKRANRSTILRVLHNEGPMSRKRLAGHLKLTPAAITKITGEMIEEGILSEGKSIRSSSAGHREVEIEFNEKNYYALGLFINLRHAEISGIRLDGTVVFSKSVSYPAKVDADATLALLCGELSALAENNIDEKGKILGVGIAIRGITASDGRIVRNTFGAFSSSDYPLADKVEELTGYPAVMSNNVRALFLAHSYLSNDGSLSSCFFLRCEYGIGASLSINNSMWTGATQQCAEIGHIPVVRRGGKLCSCGKYGCLETIASPMALLEDAGAILTNRNEESPGELTLDKIFSMAQNGDSEIAALVDRAVISLAAALKNVIYLIDPEKIVLYGQMFENPFYLSKLYAEMGEGVDTGHKTAIEKSRFNRRLEDKAAGILVADKFINTGALIS